MKASNWVKPVSAAAALAALGLIVSLAKPWRWLTGSSEITVAVATVKLETRPVILRFSGELQPLTEVEVVSRLAGRLTEVKFKTGDTVTSGAVVASVYSGETAERVRVVEIELNAVRKQLQEREQQAAAADQQLARQKEYYRQELIAWRDVEQAESQAATARAQLELARAQVAQEEAMLVQARKLQQLAHVVAPIAGVVTGVLPVGMPVNETRAILTIAQVDRLKLVGEVGSDSNELIHDGMTALVTPRDGAVGARTGKVVRLDEKGKVAGGNIPIEITVDNRDRALAAGTMVDAALDLGHQEQVLTAPRSALQSLGDKHYVFQISNGRATRRIVEIDESTTDPVVIRHGLTAGDRVIVERLGAIKDGLRVVPAGNAK